MRTVQSGGLKQLTAVMDFLS